MGRKVWTVEGEPQSFVIDCPACSMAHKFDKRWTFNGNMELPTFRASMLVKWAKCDPVTNLLIKDIVCHSFVTDGKIQYLADCTHDMAGQTVDLPDVD